MDRYIFHNIKSKELVEEITNYYKSLRQLENNEKNTVLSSLNPELEREIQNKEIIELI